jgi:hypothetical protein
MKILKVEDALSLPRGDERQTFSEDEMFVAAATTFDPLSDTSVGAMATDMIRNNEQRSFSTRAEMWEYFCAYYLL